MNFDLQGWRYPWRMVLLFHYFWITVVTGYRNDHYHEILGLVIGYAEWRSGLCILVLFKNLLALVWVAGPLLQRSAWWWAWLGSCWGQTDSLQVGSPLGHTHTNGEEQSDPVGRSLLSMKKCQESEPALISVIFSFQLCLSKLKHPHDWLKNRKSEKTVSVLYYFDDRW